MVNYFYIENISNSRIHLNFAKKDYNLQYTTTPTVESSWVNYDFNAQPNFGKKISKIYFRGTNKKVSGINCDKAFNVGGDITTLLIPNGNLLDLTNYNNCFENLFLSSKNLNNANNLILPSTTLAPYCYKSMFEGCTSLVNAPKVLPATTLTPYCYNYMFANCPSLVNVSKVLPAKNLAESCYSCMFEVCTSLVNAPELPATTLAGGCYFNMFRSCTSLVNAPKVLPATTLVEGCYFWMFQNCASLVTAPELPATALANSCYDSMFEGCTKLNYIKVGALSWDEYSTNNWVSGVSPTGTFEKPSSTSIPIGVSGIPTGWTVQDIKPVNYFYIENVYNGENVLTLDSNYGMTNVEYTTDPNGVWTAVTFDTNTKKATINISSGGKVYLRGINQTLSNYHNDILPIISCSQSFNVGGDLTTLLKKSGNVLDLTGRNYVFGNLFFKSPVADVSKLILPSTTLADRCYYNMFNGCTSLVNATELPATTLGNNCYESMFYDCTSLVTAPQLPATTLDSNCYKSMFCGCTSLTQAPELPAKTLRHDCYNFMFCGCTSLTQAPELPAKTLVESCYDGMFSGCKALQTAPELPAKTILFGCYFGMFSGCTSLVNAPELPATTLGSYCYNSMFKNCTSLVNAPKLPAKTLSHNCYYNMFSGCTSLTTAPKLPATKLIDGCYSYMFNGCTSLTQAPQLPAKTLFGGCRSMFNGCTKLNYIKVGALSWDEYSTNNWVSGVSPTGTFEKYDFVDIPIGVNGIPDGWVIKDIHYPKVESSKHIQLKRNKVLYNSKDEIIGVNGVWKNIEFIKQLRDGEIILGRYKENTKVHTILGIVNIIKSGDVISNESFIYSFEKIININNNINNNTHDIILDENLNGNRKAIKILKNKDIFKDKDEIIGPFGLWNNFGFIKQLKDGEMVIGRYNNNNGKVKTIIGVSYINYINGEIDKESYIEYFI